MRRLMTATRPRPARGAARGRAVPAWRRTLLRALPVALPVALVCGLAGWLVLGGVVTRAVVAVEGAFEEVAADAGLTVDRVLVSGRERTDRRSLIEALGIAIGDPILGVDLAMARARVAALPWVREASVERYLPDAVVVTVIERRPLAVWQNDGSFHVVDAEGHVIDGAHARDFPQLLLVVGPDAPRSTADLLAVMERTPELRDRVVAAVRVGNRRWNLRLDDGIEIQLPESDLALAWRMLVDLEDAEQLLARDVQAVDLRLPDRLVLRLTPDALARMSGKTVEGKDT